MGAEASVLAEKNRDLFDVVVVALLRCIPLFVTPWTVACQAPLSMGFSRQDSGMGCHSLLQEIFPTQGSNSGLLHCRQILYCLSYQGSPYKLLYVEQVTNKNLLNSTGNFIQYSVMTYTGTESKKSRYMCVYNSLTAEMNTTL